MASDLATVSRGEYGVPEGIRIDYPVMSDGASWRVAEDLKHDAAAFERLRVTTEEPVQERSLADHLLPH